MRLEEAFERISDWVKSYGWAVFTFLAGVGFCLTLLYGLDWLDSTSNLRWNWSIIWTSIAAMANVALAFATFSIIRRDSKASKLERRPIVLISKVEPAVTEKGAGLSIGIANLGKSLIYIPGVIKSTENPKSQIKQFLGVVVSAGQIETVVVTLPVIGISKAEFRFYFQVGAALTESHRLTLVGSFAIEEDRGVSFSIINFFTESSVNIFDESPHVVSE